MIFNNYLVVIPFAAIVAAQSSASLSASGTDSASGPLPSISPCILSCTEPAAIAAGCTAITDLACVCNSVQFQQAATACLQANCTSAEQTTALGLQSAECAAGGVSGSASASALPSISSTLSSSALSSSLSLSSSLPVPVSSISSASRASIAASGTSLTNILTTPTSSAAGSTGAVSTAPPATASTGAASSTVASIWGVAIGLVGAAAAAAAAF